MEDLSLDLNDRHRRVLFPAFLMLSGGVLAAFSRRKQTLSEPGTKE
jgi:hypothetical protein